MVWFGLFFKFFAKPNQTKPFRIEPNQNQIDWRTNQSRPNRNFRFGSVRFGSEPAWRPPIVSFILKLQRKTLFRLMFHLLHCMLANSKKETRKWSH